MYRSTSVNGTVESKVRNGVTAIFSQRMPCSSGGLFATGICYKQTVMSLIGDQIL
jgi:hypothetical protein